MNNSAFHTYFNNLSKEFHFLTITMTGKFSIPPTAGRIEPMQGIIDLFRIGSRLPARR